MHTFFPGQQANERVYLLTRQHPIILFKRIAFWLMFVVLLIILDSYILPQYAILAQAPYLQIVNFIKSVYIMVLVIGIFTIWILYYLNYQIITNERIVDVTQNTLLHHTTSELHLHRVQDVTAEVKGLVGNLFGYGNVYVQTAGETARFEFNKVPQPHKVEKLILDLYEQLPPEEKHKGLRE